MDSEQAVSGARHLRLEGEATPASFDVGGGGPYPGKRGEKGSGERRHLGVGAKGWLLIRDGRTREKGDVNSHHSVSGRLDPEGGGPS